MTRPESCWAPRARYERGQAIILAVLILALGTGFLVFSLASPRAITAQKNAETEAALAQAKQMLIGWSASRMPTVGNPTYRPGELPCPDMDNDGSAEPSCVAGAIGRVPWKTLGIPEPRDGSGEILWFGIAGPFRYKPQASQPITSDTLGTLTVYQGNITTILTSQAIAVLIAPGPPVGSQDRGTSSAICSNTGTNIPNNLCAANYLDAISGNSNAQTGGPFIQAPASATFNDRVIALTNADLMPLVEQRVAHEIMAILEQYKLATGEYPWADLSNGSSNNTYNRARFPCGTAQPTNWASGGTPTLPDWLTNGCTNPVTGWTSVIYYAVARNRLENNGAGCTTCIAGTLTVTNSGNRFADLCVTGAAPFTCTSTVVTSGSADVVIMTPGAATTSRAGGWSDTGFNPITGYFEDAENSDNNDDNYVVPTSTNYDRDRMYIVR